MPHFLENWIVIGDKKKRNHGDPEQRVSLPIHSKIEIIPLLKLVSLTPMRSKRQYTFWVLKKEEGSSPLCKSGAYNRDAILPLQ